MTSELDKMLGGELYDPNDASLVQMRERSIDLCRSLNSGGDQQTVARKLFASVGKNFAATPTFQCDYGSNIHLGNQVFFNFNCVILDTAPVTIGDNTMFGPAVQIYTPIHPLGAIERRTMLEYSKPVTIGDDVWVGGGAIICPGVTIGDRTVIGAGSVVTKDIPPDVFAAGNPSKVLKQLKPIPKGQ